MFPVPEASAGWFGSEMGKAKEYISANMYPQAAALLEEEINDDPGNAEAHYLLGKCYLNIGDIEKAEDRFKSAIKLKPDEYAALIGDEFMSAGMSFLKSDKYDTASALFYKAIEYRPDLKSKIVPKLLASGKTTLESGQPEKAYEIFRVAHKMKSDAGGDISDIYFHYAQTQEHNQQLIDILGKASEFNDKNNKEIGKLLARLCDMKTTTKEDKKIFKREAAKYLSKDEFSKYFPMELDDYLEKGVSISSAKKIMELVEYTEKHPGNIEKLVNLGNLYFDNNLYEIAIETYEKALRLDPKNASVLTDLGIMYRNNGNSKKTLECFDKAILIDPELEEAYFNKGVVLYVDFGDKNGAINTWKKLLSINPSATAPNGVPVIEMLKELRRTR